MGWSVQDVLGRHNSRQLAYWMAYYRLEPFGEEPAWLRAGIIASTQANCHRGKHQKVWKPSDFIPNFLPKVKQTARDIRGAFEKLTVLLGGKVNGDGRKSQGNAKRQH